jgi:hypothetical protein
MAFGLLESVWRAVTGTVVWRKDIHFRNGTRISFRVKRQNDKSYVVMVIVHHYYVMDLRDLQNLEGALVATKNSLDASRLQTLAQQKEVELMRLGKLEKIWRWISESSLWKEDVFLGSGAKISFRIRRKVDRHAEIVFGTGEESGDLVADLRELEVLEETLLATRAVLAQQRNSD